MSLLTYRYGLYILLLAMCATLLAPPSVLFASELEDQYEQIRRMPAGEQKTRSLENLVFNLDQRGRLGPEPVEQLAWIYIDNNQIDRAIGLLNTLDDRNSYDYELMFKLAQMIWEQRQDMETVTRLLNKATEYAQLGRRRPDKDEYDAAYYVETNQILGKIHSFYATIYLSKDNYQKADQHLSKAMSYRVDPRDYALQSRILLQKGRLKARSCLGAAMVAMYRGEIPEARMTFKSAYDSLEWDVHKLDDYIKSFQELYITTEANIILQSNERTRVESLSRIPIQDILSSAKHGVAVVFWGDETQEWNLKGLEDLAKMLDNQGIPNLFVYAGENYGEQSSILRQQRYSFMGMDTADLEAQKMYRVTHTPMVCIVDRDQRIRYRIEGPNRNIHKLFKMVWDKFAEVEDAR